MEAQLKCCSLTLKQNKPKTARRYSLKAKNYNELVGNHYVPRILIVVLAPPLPTDWLSHSADELVLRKCGYWASLRSQSERDNESSVNIDLPNDQLFTPDALSSLLAGGTGK